MNVHQKKFDPPKKVFNLIFLITYILKLKKIIWKVVKLSEFVICDLFHSQLIFTLQSINHDSTHFLLISWSDNLHSHGDFWFTYNIFSVTDFVPFVRDFSCLKRISIEKRWEKLYSILTHSIVSTPSFPSQYTPTSSFYIFMLIYESQSQDLGCLVVGGLVDLHHLTAIIFELLMLFPTDDSRIILSWHPKLELLRLVLRRQVTHSFLSFFLLTILLYLRLIFFRLFNFCNLLGGTPGGGLPIRRHSSIGPQGKSDQIFLHHYPFLIEGFSHLLLTHRTKSFSYEFVTTHGR